MAGDVRYRAGMRGRDDRRARATAHELARYEALFATRTRGMKSSAMREMMALTERPEVISLAGGLPDTSTFEPELYAKLMARVAAESTARALQYGPTEGMAATVECIVEVMASEGTEVDPAEVIVTTGGQQVIDLVCKTLIDPGDVIVAEGPTYPGAVPTFTAYQADVEQIEMDADGMLIDALEETLDRLHEQGRRPMFIYTIPNFQNPTGRRLPLERRQALAAFAQTSPFPVIEDDPYGALLYAGEPLPTVHSMAPDHVVHLGSFSKVLAPGLRVGYIIAPEDLHFKLVQAKQATDLHTPSFTQRIVYEVVKDGFLDTHIPKVRALYRDQCEAMLD